MTLVDFSEPQEAARWAAIDDAVMGGLSCSSMRFDPGGHAVFSGTVSFDNNGGFASVRRQPGDLACTRVVAYLVEVCGDGKRYKLNLRGDDGFDGINYQFAFQPPAGVWATCRLDCSRFVPTWRGRVLVDKPPFDPTRLRQFGLVIGDRQEGRFSLAIRAIRADLHDA